MSFISTKIEQYIDPIIEAYAADSCMEVNYKFSKGPLQTRQKMEVNIDKALQLNNFCYWTRSPSLLYFHTQHSFVFCRKFFDLKKSPILRIRPEIMSNSGKFISREHKTLKRRWISQNLFNTDEYERKTQSFVPLTEEFITETVKEEKKDKYGNVITDDYGNPVTEKVTRTKAVYYKEHLQFFDRNEILVNPQFSTPDEDESKRWAPGVEILQFSSVASYFLSWLRLQPTKQTYLVGSLDLPKIFNYAHLHYKSIDNCMRFWWIKSLHFSLTDQTFKSLVSQLFIYKIKFFDSELIKHSHKLSLQKQLLDSKYAKI